MFTHKNILSGMLVCLISVSGFAETIYVNNTNNSGAGSLRDAIIAANANISPTDIVFNISGTAGVERIITLPSALPAFTTEVKVKTDALQTGRTVLLASPGQNFTGFVFSAGSSKSTVDGITFRQFLNGITGTGSELSILNNIFELISNDAVNLNQVHQSKVNSNGIYNISGRGIVITGGTENVIQGNDLAVVTGWDIFVSGGHTNKIANSTIYGSGTFSGIFLENGLSYIVDNNKVTIGSLELTAVNGSVNPVLITNNRIFSDPRNTAGHGALQLTNSSNVRVESNLLQDNVGYALSLINSSSITVRSNNLDNNTSAGIYVSGGQYNKISRNLIRQNYQIAIPRPGIVSNNLKAAPVITSAKRIGNNFVISGTGTAANDTVELFAGRVSQNNVSNFNANTFIIPVKATGSTWSITIPASGEDFFAVTSTSQNGNTSAFSAPKAIEINGPTSAARNTTYSYNTGVIPGVNYQWWIGGDAAVTSGQGTSNASITFGPSFSSAFVYVGFTHPVSGWTVYQLPVTYNSALKQASAELLPVDGNVYPNPFPSTTRVQLKSNTDQPATLHLYDDKGNQVYHSEGHPAGEAVEIGQDLPAGTYLLRVIAGEDKQVIRVIKSE